MGCVVLVVYVDDIILTDSDEVEIVMTKAYLCQHFVTRDLSPPLYFLGLEYASRPYHIVLCQRKYSLDLIEETGMLGGNLVTWRSKNQSVVSRSSAESEYRAMADTTSEMLRLRSLLIELGFPPPLPMKMYCNNEATTFISSNDTFHMRTKHIEIDYHFI